MKRRNILLVLTLALGLVSCNKDFSDWGVPQTNGENCPAEGGSGSISVTQSTNSVDFTQGTVGETIQLFTVTSGKAEEGFIVQLAEDEGHYDISATSDGKISSKDLKTAVRMLGGKAKVASDYTATVSKENSVKTPDGTVSTRYQSEPFDLSVKLSYDQATGSDAIYGDGFDARPLADGTVAIYKIFLNDDSSTEVTIPTSIKTYDETTGEVSAEYEVSQVGFNEWGFRTEKDGENVFSTFVTKLVLSEGIKLIDKGAFTNWGSNNVLQSVTLPSTLTGIKAGAFSGCDALREIVCNAQVAPLLLADSSGWADNYFRGSDTAGWDYIVKNCKVYVPTEAAKETYNTTDWSYWKAFYENGNVVVKTE